MQMNLKKLLGAVAIAGAFGLPAFVVGAGPANAATPAPSIPGPMHSVQTPADPGATRAQPVDWDGGGNGWGWGGDGNRDRGWGGRGGGDRDDHGWGGGGGWGWGLPGGWGGWGWGR